MNNIEFKSTGNLTASATIARDEFESFIFKFLHVAAAIALPGSLLVIVIQRLADSANIASALALLVAAFSMYFLAFRSFYRFKLRGFVNVSAILARDKILAKEKCNIFLSLSPDLAKAMLHMEYAKNGFSTDQILKKIASSADIYFVLNRLGVGKDSFVQFQSDKLLLNDKLWLSALDIAIRFGHFGIDSVDLLLAIILVDKKLAASFDQFGAGPEDISNVIVWRDHINARVRENEGFLNPKRLHFSGGIGRDWAYGYANYLRRFAVDITESINRFGYNLEIVGKDDETKAIEQALAKGTNANAIVVGDPGVGKRTVVMNFINKVALGETSQSLAFRHIYEVKTEYLLSGIENQGEAAERLTGVFDEASRAGNIIIFIDNIASLLSSGEAGEINASEVLLKYLSVPNMSFVFTMDTMDYNSIIGANKTLMEKIEKVEVAEPSPQDLIQILEKSVFAVEYHDKCYVTYETIKEVIRSANKYILNLPNPEKSINLLESVCSKAVAERGETMVLPKDVENFISQRYKVPGLASDKAEKEKLLNLENKMHQSVVGQDRAISAIANAMRRSRSGVTDSAKPIGSFLLLGPTGVGKTETAKTLARIYFGDESRMIRFDMSEYQNKEDVYRLIGSSIHGENETGTLATTVLNNPFSLVLLDEIEKAHPDILNLFLQVLDEGILTSGMGQKISFANTIIIATSNAGSNFIRESVETGMPLTDIESQLLDQVQKDGIFKPEFLNRFSAAIVFHPLDMEQTKQVAVRMIAKLQQNVLKNQGVTFTVDDQALTTLAQLGYSPEMGARPMARVISEKIENLLAKKLLSGELQHGQTFNITQAEIA
ncbi:MAG: ATP-dependent Clp protease ATP-binding subunit [Candidatus Berkelbacteria bacterium]